MKHSIFPAAAALLLAPAAWPAQGILHTFKQKPTGINPFASLVSDSAGNLYGTTLNGGANTKFCFNGCGTVFRLAPNGTGGYTYSFLYAFLGGNQNFPNPDAASPNAPLVVDGAGNLWGTSSNGGASGTGGTVFELSPQADGSYKEQLIYSFIAGGTGPVEPAGLVLDSAGNLYGSTINGGTHNQSGTAYELSPTGTGSWTATVLHDFTGGTDGQYPYGVLLRDSAGNLYGSTRAGGTSGQGVVFELSPAGDGTWNEAVLYNFQGGFDGCSPFQPTFDSAGNIYGIAGCGPSGYQGIVFRLTLSGGVWTKKTIHKFSTTGGEGYAPTGLALDSGGNLYVTTLFGGAYNWGALIQLSPNLNGTWTEKQIHAFTGGTDGAQPESAVIVGIDGNLYGVTPYGGIASGQSGYGIAYSTKP